MEELTKEEIMEKENIGIRDILHNDEKCLGIKVGEKCLKCDEQRIPGMWICADCYNKRPNQYAV